MDIYIGRQPIYNKNLQLVGYELLFRSDKNNQATINNGTLATSEVIINSCLEIGLDKIVGKRQAFINITTDYLLRQDELMLPKENVVLEILEDVECNEETINGIRKLKSHGHKIALDDYILSDTNKKFLLYADIVKIDIREYDEKQLAEVVNHIEPYNISLLAEKVETKEEFDFCAKIGFERFQGYFLSKPQVLKGKKVPNNKLALLNLLSSLQNPKVSVSDQENIIRKDVTLSYGLLRYINSPAFDLTREIASVRQAVMLLGIQNIRKWATLISLGRLKDCPMPLLLNSMVRAKMCELLAQELAYDKTDTYFTAGLFSLLDAILETSMEDVIEHLPLSDDITEALLSRDGNIGNILDVSIAWEENIFDQVDILNLDHKRVHDIYLDAINFGENTLSEMTKAA